MTGAAAHRIDIHEIADRLWEAADELRANSHLKAGEYSIPALELVFRKLQIAAPARSRPNWRPRGSAVGRSARPTTRPGASSTSPKHFRFAHLLQLMESENLVTAIHSPPVAI